MVNGFGCAKVLTNSYSAPLPAGTEVQLRRLPAPWNSGTTADGLPSRCAPKPRIQSLLLYRLEERGWIKGAWVEKAEERRRGFYRVTAEGRRVLARLCERDASGEIWKPLTPLSRNKAVQLRARSRNNSPREVNTRSRLQRVAVQAVKHARLAGCVPGK